MARPLSLAYGDELSEKLGERMTKALKEYDPEVPNTVIRSPSNKWIVSSAWQKAIRRGDVVTAHRMVHGLMTVDPGYVWRRIPVVAFEDIGVAGLMEVAEVIWVSGRSVWRRENGGHVKVALYLTERLARSNKDRMACDLEVWTDLDESLKDLRAELRHTDSKDLFAMAINPGIELERRHLALRYLAGTKMFPGHNIGDDRLGTFEDVIHVCRKLDLSDEVTALIVWARNKAGSMALSLVYAVEMMAHAEELKIVPDKLIELPKVGPYPSYALDVHCYQGKRASAYFTKSCKEMTVFLKDIGVPSDKWSDAVSEFLFRAEGDQLDKRLVYGQSRRVQRGSWTASVGGWAGVPDEYIEEGVALMSDNMETMHKARCRVMGVD